MTVSTTTAADEQTMESVIDTVQDAGDAVRRRHRVHHAAGVTGTGLIRSVSRATYTGAYALAFAIVYPVVFATKFIPQDNPVMDGFSDGAHDAVDAVKGTGSANHAARPPKRHRSAFSRTCTRLATNSNYSPLGTNPVF